MSDPNFREICRAEELPVGRCRKAEIDGRVIALYHVEQGFFASDNACPHRGGPLAEGDLIGSEIVCPWHLWSFDVTSGVNPGSPEGQEIRVQTHQVRVDGGLVMVRLADSGTEPA